MGGDLDDDAVGQVHPKRGAGCGDAHRHEGGGRPWRAQSAGRLGEHATALERRARAIQGADRQPLGVCIRLQRLALFTTGAEMVEPEWVARLGLRVGSGNRASHDRRLHVTRERAPWHDRRGYGTTYFSKRLLSGSFRCKDHGKTDPARSLHRPRGVGDGIEAEGGAIHSPSKRRSTMSMGRMTFQPWIALPSPGLAPRAYRVRHGASARRSASTRFGTPSRSRSRSSQKPSAPAAVALPRARAYRGKIAAVEVVDGGVAARACIPDQCRGVDARHQIQRVEELLRAPGQIATVEQVHDRPLDHRHIDPQPQTVDHHHAISRCRVSWGEAARWLDEPAGESDRLERARLPARDDLHLISLAVGAAVQLKRRVTGDDRIAAQAGSSQKAIDGPGPGIGVLGHGREHTARDTPDVARPLMLGEHRGDGPVAGAAANGGSVFFAAEDRVCAEEGRGYEPRHGGFGMFH